MWRRMLEELTKTPASSKIGRFVQLLKGARLTAPRRVVPPSNPPGSDAAFAEGQKNKP